jgi:glycosyltransferase involved in cell wall biosynthesis
MLSAVIITKNEEQNITGCLENLRWCDEIIVVDDYSKDQTVSQTQNYKAKLKVYRRYLNGDFAAQRNFGLNKATGDWVLFIDADEKITPLLQKEIQSAINNQQSTINGFYLKRKDKFLGKCLRFGETASVRLLRLAKIQKGRWEGKIHETWKISGKIGNLQHPLIHERNLSIAEFLQRINKYSDIRAQELYQQGARTNIFFVFLYPLGKFLADYILKLGFLDGIPGLIMAGMMSLHSFMARSKLWVMTKNKGKEEFSVDWQKYA